MYHSTINLLALDASSYEYWLLPSSYGKEAVLYLNPVAELVAVLLSPY